MTGDQGLVRANTLTYCEPFPTVAVMADSRSDASGFSCGWKAISALRACIAPVCSCFPTVPRPSITNFDSQSLVLMSKLQTQTSCYCVGFEKFFALAIFCSKNISLPSKYAGNPTLRLKALKPIILCLA